MPAIIRLVTKLLHLLKLFTLLSPFLLPAKSINNLLVRCSHSRVTVIVAERSGSKIRSVVSAVYDTAYLVLCKLRSSRQVHLLNM